MATFSDLTESLVRYRDGGIETGSGLRAVLENKLYETMLRVDLETRALLIPLLQWMDQSLPPECHGSREKVDEWIRAKREERRRREQDIEVEAG